MKRVLIAIAALAVAQGALAGALQHHPLRHHFTTRHRRYAARRIPHFSVEMRDNGQFAKSTYAPAPRQQADLKPTVERRIGKTRAVASLGYNKGAVGQTLDPHELNGAAATRLGNSESTAGVSVKIPF